MPLGSKRSVLQAIAQAKLEDALLLLKHGRHSNAYYISGYAVEIGLKACIAKQIVAETIPDKTFINDIYKHGLKHLVGVAGLAGELSNKLAADPSFATSWALVAGWTPESRYETIDTFSAQAMIQAVADSNSGVFPWIKTVW